MTIPEIHKPMSKVEMIRQPYPMNMLLSLTDKTILEPPTLTEDVLAGLEYALSVLNDREREILRQRFEQRKPVVDIAADFGVTKSRIRECEYNALRKLRQRTVLGYILYGRKGFAERNYIYHYASNDASDGVVASEQDVYTITIEELDLTVHAYTYLRRAGYAVVGDIADLSTEQIQAIGHLHDKNREEIAMCLRRLGLKNTEWDKYLNRGDLNQSLPICINQEGDTMVDQPMKCNLDIAREKICKVYELMQEKGIQPNEDTVKQLEEYPYTGKTEVCLELSDIMVHTREGMRTERLYIKENGECMRMMWIGML